jgi:hypothetical protein
LGDDPAWIRHSLLRREASKLVRVAIGGARLSINAPSFLHPKFPIRSDTSTSDRVLWNARSACTFVAHHVEEPPKGAWT